MKSDSLLVHLHTPLRKSNCASATNSDTRRARTDCRTLLHMENHLYTEPGCSACIEAKSFLKSRGISFEERDVRANSEYLRILTEDLDSCTLPTLVRGGTIIVGFDMEMYQRLPTPIAAKFHRSSDGSEVRMSPGCRPALKRA
jgi:glutaredoxin